jgi:hypothetical protein
VTPFSNLPACLSLVGAALIRREVFHVCVHTDPSGDEDVIPACRFGELRCEDVQRNHAA